MVGLLPRVRGEVDTVGKGVNPKVALREGAARTRTDAKHETT